MSVTQIINLVITIISVFIIVTPVAWKLFKLLTINIHTKEMDNLKKQGDLIVKSLLQSDLQNYAVKDQGVQKLLDYASESNVKLVEDQAKKYIKAAMQENGAVDKEVTAMTNPSQK